MDNADDEKYKNVKFLEETHQLLQCQCVETVMSRELLRDGISLPRLTAVLCVRKEISIEWPVAWYHRYVRRS